MSFTFLRGFNLIINDSDSLHLEIEEMKLSGLEEKGFDFTAGGSTQETDVPLLCWLVFQAQQAGFLVA